MYDQLTREIQSGKPSMKEYEETVLECCQYI